MGNEGTVLWLREDTTARKVYARKRSPAWSNDTAEFLLYDFSQQPGDSILLYNARFNGSWYLYELDTIGWFYLDSITLSNTTGGQRRKFHFTKAEFTTIVSLNNMQWIEGIGAVDGYYLFGNAESLANNWLDCVYSGTIQLYDGSPYVGPPDGVCFCNWDNANTISNDMDLEVYPVPTDQKLFVQTTNVSDKSVAVLSDLTGRTLMSQPVVATIEFDVRLLLPGVYLLKIYPYRKTVKVIVSR